MGEKVNWAEFTFADVELMSELQIFGWASLLSLTGGIVESAEAGEKWLRHGCGVIGRRMSSCGPIAPMKNCAEIVLR